MIEKFSISEAIGYAYKTYFKNFNFFLKVFGISSIGSICFYFAQLNNPQLFSGPSTTILKFFAQFVGILVLDVLILKGYEDSNILRLKDFFNYYFYIGSYFMYYCFLYGFEYFPYLIIKSMNITDPGLNCIWCLLIGGFTFFILINYSLGKYLTLDKDLTFRQSLRATPYLVCGEKKAILLAWCIYFLLILLPWTIFTALLTYFITGSLNNSYSSFFMTPFAITFQYPMSTLMGISIYKQLMTNVDENFKKGLLEFQKLNEYDDNEDEDEFEDEAL